MARSSGSLSDRMQARIDRTKKGTYRTKVKRDESGNVIGGGTRVTQDTVNSVRSDEAANLIIVQDNTAIIQAALGRAITAALEEIGLVAEGAAKRLCPVDTGRLRNSITHALIFGEDAVAIGTNVEYAIYVHEGTSRRKGKPFLRDAAQSNYGRFQSIVRKHMQEA